MSDLKITRTDSGNKDFQDLVVFLDAYLAEKDGDDHPFFAQYNGIDKIKHVVVAYIDNKAVGCGALKERKERTVEIKRMYVLPEFRGQGIAKKILAELENWAYEVGNSHCILETGKKQTAAIELYQRTGYKVIDNFDPYIGIDLSICFGKTIGKDAILQ